MAFILFNLFGNPLIVVFYYAILQTLARNDLIPQSNLTEMYNVCPAYPKDGNSPPASHVHSAGPEIEVADGSTPTSISK